MHRPVTAALTIWRGRTLLLVAALRRLLVDSQKGLRGFLKKEHKARHLLFAAAREGWDGMTGLVQQAAVSTWKVKGLV